MRGSLLTWFAVGMLMAGVSVCNAQTPKAVQNPGGIKMSPVEGLRQKGIGPKVIGGKEANTENWRASFYSKANGSRCTATLIGPDILLLAAHCVGNGHDAEIELVDKSTVSGPCTHAAEYKNGMGDPSADYAICKLKSAISGFSFETVSLDPKKIKKGQKLLLTGYGCTQPPPPGGSQPSGGNDGKYRTGEAKIVMLPGDPGNEPNTILTRDEIAVCPGDSGGGAYVVLTATRRLLVSVNSRVWYDKGESYLSSVSAPAGAAFFKKWMAGNPQSKICGINLTNPCR